MKHIRPLSIAAALISMSAPTWAAQHDLHKGHHPAASVATANTMPSKTTPEMAQMANQMKAMQEMHNKMMAAKTPEERNALMADHMKSMQDGMGMMKGMGGSGGVGAMSGPKASPADMAQRQAQMEQRMDMMQTMMEMMADRLPQSSARP